MTARSDGVRIPLYQQVKRSLLAAIARGEYAPDSPFVTERKVCERFGVSTTTAVRALNELVAEGVLVRRQGSGTFVADRSAFQPTVDVGAAHTRRPAVACILQGQGPHVTQLLGGVEATCAELGYQLILTHCHDNPEREGRALREALESNVTGIVLYPAEGNANVEVFADLRRREMPLVMVDRYRPDVATDAVAADNVAVGYEVTQHLIRLGHRRIATLWDETDCTSVRDRLTGHVQALRDNGIPVRPDLTVLRKYAPASGPDQGSVAALLARPDPPSVLLCGNGYAMGRAVLDLVALGIDVPGQVDLAGMDDASPLDILPLAAIAATLPSYEMGREAALLLHRRITSGDPYRDVEHLVLPIAIRTRDAAPGHLRVVLAE
ncbi:GntR family transcriptional regulator [Actinopolymorpha alba]|uniref:GntR family transcriptional regulator n=1 Tax=Actinopolymorpha alba TaxID=533267 RepID=UPI000368746D|nr:GntR family transcriptional regulator [Actinopolymorpha alba]